VFGDHRLCRLTWIDGIDNCVTYFPTPASEEVVICCVALDVWQSFKNFHVRLECATGTFWFSMLANRHVPWKSTVHNCFYDPLSG